MECNLEGSSSSLASIPTPPRSSFGLPLSRPLRCYLCRQQVEPMLLEGYVSRCHSQARLSWLKGSWEARGIVSRELSARKTPQERFGFFPLMSLTDGLWDVDGLLGPCNDGGPLPSQPLLLLLRICELLLFLKLLELLVLGLVGSDDEEVRLRVLWRHVNGNEVVLRPCDLSLNLKPSDSHQSLH